MQTETGERRPVRVVSMPCPDRFDAQPASYRQTVLPDCCRARVAIEAGIGEWWRKYVGLDGAVIGVDGFGESGPAPDVLRHFGFSVESVAQTVERVIAEAPVELARAV